MTIGLNQMTARNLPILRFLDVARELGCRGVELRNDLSQPLFDGMSAHQAGKEAQARDLTVFCLSEVYGFNDLTAERLDQVHELISLAQALGAAAIGLIPRNDGQDCDASTRKANLRAALREIAPLLRAAGIVGMIEPLGFETASLRLKAEAIDAIEATGNAAQFKIIHDTFHHHIAGETVYFPQATGMMHVSGVTDPTLGAGQMRDAHRGFVDGADVLGNMVQIKEMRGQGYAGPISVEAFAPHVHELADPAPALRRSIDYMQDAVCDMAA